MWSSEEKYSEALEKISKNCPDCKGHGAVIHSEKHEFWGFWVDEVYEVPCETCNWRLCNIQQYYIIESRKLGVPF